MSKLLMVALLAVLTSGCGGSLMVHRPQDAALDRDITQLWAQEIRSVAQPGDWLLSRSYSAVGDAITVASADIFSHSAIYDAENDEVIESVNGHGVRAIPLVEFLHRNSLVVVVRPSGLDARQRQATVARARLLIGAPYDKQGLLGLDDPDAYYCSELNLWAVRGEERGYDVGLIVTPGELIDLGEPVYVVRRDRSEVQARARGNARRNRELHGMFDRSGRAAPSAVRLASRMP